MVLFWTGISAPDIAHASEFNLETVLVFHKLIHVQGVNNVWHCCSIRLIHVMPRVSFYTPENIFLMFSGVIERDQLREAFIINMKK